jgi:hypothetical protein
MKAKNIFGTLVLAGLLSCSGSLFADPLNNWHWRNPLPNGNPPPNAIGLYGIVFTNGQFFAVGANGTENTSGDGTNWTLNATATTNQLNDIIYANGKFVAVGDNGAVETSANGTNWVLQNSGTTSSLSSVAYGNGKFAAVGGAVISSANAVSWSPSVSGLSSASQVAGSSSGFVAVNGGDQAYFSQDGLTWTNYTLTNPVPNYGQYETEISAQIVTYAKGRFLIGSWMYPDSGSIDLFMFSSPDGRNWATDVLAGYGSPIFPQGYYYFMTGTSNVIAAGVGYGDILQISPDGQNWSTIDFSDSQGLGNAGTYGNGVYVIALSSQFWYTSIDSVNWTSQTNIPTSVGPASTFNSIAYSNGMYVVASSSSFVDSTNDSTYVIESNTPSLSSVVAFSNGFIGVGSSGQIYQSTNGYSWYQRNSGTTSNLHGVTTGNNLLIAVGDSGTIQTSSSGLVWATRDSSTSLSLYSVVYSNGLYVAVGQEGTVVSSPDGVTWTPQYSGVLDNLLSVTYGSAGFLAVGTNSTMVTSPDGINWTQQEPGVSASFDTASFGNGYYLIAGKGSIVMTSPDGVNWTSRNVGATGGQTLYGSGFLNGRFDVIGSGGIVIESDPVPPLFDIQIHDPLQQNTFTVFATPGSTFRIQSCTNLAAPVWSTVATFNNASAITYWSNSTGLNPCFFRAVSP